MKSVNEKRMLLLCIKHKKNAIIVLRTLSASLVRPQYRAQTSHIFNKILALQSATGGKSKENFVGIHHIVDIRASMRVEGF